MPDTHPRRRGTALAACAAALLALTGCAAADRAVLTAPPCAGGKGVPPTPVSTPGTVYAWRPHFITHNVPGQTPTPTPTPQPPPVDPKPVPGWTDVVSVASSGRTTFAVKTDGTVWAYGVGYHGMLGDGDLSLHAVTEPQQIPGITDARSVHVVGNAVFVVRSGGAVLGWGEDVLTRGAGGPIDLSRGRQHVASPIPVDGLDDVAYALDVADAVWAWGRGINGALGDGDTSDHVSAVPTVVAGLPPARWIGAWGLTGYAIDTGGRLWAWGSSVPLGDLAPLPGTGRPVQIPMPGPVLSVSGTHAIIGSASPEST